MKYVELFAGIGGMGHGLMRAGMECVGYAEIDKFAHKAFQILHDPEERMWNAYDVRSVTDDDLRLLGRERGPVELIAGGFPCQAFSIAGKRKGFADATRGTLFFEILRYASVLRPKYLLLENVTGLLSHDEGRTFAVILCALAELGYDAEWCVLNSAAWVPQNRERVFIVASLGGSGGRKVFPFGAENSKTVEVIGRLDIKGDDYIKRVYSTDGISPCLPTMQGGMQEPKVLVVGNTNPSGNGMNGQVYNAVGLAPTLTTNKGEGIKVLQRLFAGKYSVNEEKTGTLQASRVDKVPMLVQPVLTPDREEKRQNGRRFKDPGEPAFTLTAQDKHGIYDGYRIRKLTPLECFRLQSYPDEWYHKLKATGISDSQLYKMAGNGVTSVVAYEIGKRIMELREERVTG